MADQPGRHVWIEQGARAHGVRRPDGKWLLRLPAARTDLWGPLIDRVGRELAGPLLINTIDTDRSLRDMLAVKGFSASRVEWLWRIPVASIPEPVIESTAHRLLPLDRCDLPRVVDLDNTVRADIPGTEFWHGTLADLQYSMSDDEFDPALYLIAEHTTTGSYDGLIRLWNRTPSPRIGCLGVCRQWRRTRLPIALIGAAATVLRGRGVADVITETDTSNPGSHRMAARRGTKTGELIEWESPTVVASTTADSAVTYSRPVARPVDP